MSIISLFKHWKVAIAVVIFKLLSFQLAFASMGSTGGGGTGGFSSSSGDDNNNVFLSLLAIIIYGLYVLIRVLIYLAILRYRESRDVRAVSGLEYWMLEPNMEIDDFRNVLKYGNDRSKDNRKNSKLESGQNMDSQLAQSLIDTYAKAQFTYGQAIRRCFTDNHNYLDILKQQLGHTFLVTMHEEIKNKASKGIIDDVMVNHGNIIGFKQISANVIIAKVQAIGLDNEVNVLSNFNSSFKRQQWADYVVFGREEINSEWKIYNIVYGAHFHLNGEDYNDQASLDKSKIMEQHLEVSPELVKAARSYRNRTVWKKRSIKGTIWGTIILVILYLIYKF